MSDVLFGEEEVRFTEDGAEDDLVDAVADRVLARLAAQDGETEIPVEDHLDLQGTQEIRDAAAVTTEEASTDFGKWTDRLNPLWQANRIRAEAGIPEHETVGIEDDATAGLTVDESDLTDEGQDSRIYIGSESDASDEADSGSGTEDDPYVIEEREIYGNGDGTGWNEGVVWDDPDADYYLKLQNCLIYDWDGEQVASDTGTLLIVENCKIYHNTDSYSGSRGVVQKSGDLEVRECHFAGLSSENVVGYAGSDDKLTIENCLFDEAEYDNTATHLHQQLGTGKLEVSYSDFLVDGATGIRLWRTTYETKIYNCYFNSTGNQGVHARRHRDENVQIYYCEFDFCQLRMENVHHSRVHHCFFNDAPEQDRNCLIHKDEDDRICTNIDVDHCRFIKKTGQVSRAGEECLESFYGYKIDFHHNWVEECIEDAYEHVRSNGFCDVRYCVGDNVEDQIVDYYGNGDGSGGVDYSRRQLGGVVEHIYGDSGQNVVNVHDTNGVVVKGHIYAEDRDGNDGVNVRNRNGPDGAGPNDVRVFGPLPLSDKVGEKVTVDDFTGDDMGEDNVAIYWNGDELQILDEDNVLPDNWTEFR